MAEFEYLFLNSCPRKAGKFSDFYDASQVPDLANALYLIVEGPLRGIPDPKRPREEVEKEFAQMCKEAYER